MPRSIHKLTDTGIRAEKAAGRHSDGGGLYLNVTSAGTKSWLFMWVRDGKRREMGLGAYPAISLSKARAKAAELREAVEHDRDPIAEKRQAPEPTFWKCAEAYIEANRGSWTNDKHAYQWTQTLRDKCVLLRDKRVSQITVDDVELVLRPMWLSMPETAARVRGRIEHVLNYAKTKGWRTGENPAAWRGNLKNVLPKQTVKPGRQPALPYGDMAAFMSELARHPGHSARALELTILTAARSGEMLGSRWSEFDIDGRLWTVPAERMKAREQHEVPLSTQAVRILKALREGSTSSYLFPSPLDADRPLSNMVMLMLLRRMKRDTISVHGFRSSFRDWAGDSTSFSREVAEAALAHKVGNQVEQAYRRSTALAKRAKLMQAWANYCFTPVSKSKNNVLPFAGNRTSAA